MTDTVTLDRLLSWLKLFRDEVTEQASYLTELDSAIGDADHGSNMTRGMNAVVEKISASPARTVDELFKSVGMTLVTSVGGASGPLYGTFFLRMAAAGGPVDQLDAAELGAVLRAGLEGVVQRGRAELGDKTMFDAMSPAVDAFEHAVSAGASAAEAARRAAAAPPMDVRARCRWSRARVAPAISVSGPPAIWIPVRPRPHSCSTLSPKR